MLQVVARQALATTDAPRRRSELEDARDGRCGDAGVQELPWLLQYLHEEEHGRTAINLRHLHGATAGMCCCWRAGKHGSPCSLKGQCSASPITKN